MNRTRPSLTEKTAAIAYARAINTHEIELLAPLLHDGLRVTDQRRWAPALGGRRYSGMLEDFFQAVPRERSATTMELATLPQNPYAPDPPRPCVVEYQWGRPVCTVLFHVRAGKIRQIEKRLLPPPTECELTGVYPGLDILPGEEVN